MTEQKKQKPKHKRHHNKAEHKRKPRQGDGFFSMEQRARLVQS